MIMSLRARLTLGIVILMACGLLIADVAGVVLVKRYLMQRVDQQLSLPFERNRPGTDPAAAPRIQACPTPARAGGDVKIPTSFVIIVLSLDATEQCRLPPDTAATDGPDLHEATAQQLSEQAAAGSPQTVAGFEGTTWRMRIVQTSEEFIVIAVPLAELDATVNRLTIVAIGTGIAILALAGIGGLILVRIGLRPLTSIETTAEAIAGGDLARRIPSGRPQTEVGRLSASLNTMLSQIEKAFSDRADSEQRLRRFLADASHELRTPLATIRGHAELYRQGAATSPDEVQRLLQRIESESVRMSKLVEDLLLLARLDARPDLDLHPVDLLAVAADAVVDTRAQDPDRSIMLRQRLEPPWLDRPPVVTADEARLRQILANLLSNALRHTPKGTPVEVEVGVTADAVRLHVIDHGPGLPSEQLTHLFERFYRGDAGRTRDRGGTGLGLAIVAGLVAAHGGSVRYEATTGSSGGSTFVVSLPHPDAKPSLSSLPR
jgi:two-component system, OmpR family, sensor kinase